MARLISRLSVETDKIWESFELGTTVYLMLFKRFNGRPGYDTNSWSWTLEPAIAATLEDKELAEWTRRLGMFYTVRSCDRDEEVHRWKLGKNRV